MVGRLRAMGLATLIFAALIVAPWTDAAVPLLYGEGGVPTLAPLLREVAPAVVNIATRGRVRLQENPLFRDPFFRRFFNLPEQPRERETLSVGSGVIVDAEKGYLLTNHHVIAKADEIVVFLRDRRRLEARLVGSDPEADLAVLAVRPESLVALPFGDSDALQVGDFVIAIGNPFGLGQTVTSGIVSALGRTGLGIEGYEDFIQTDAPINPGNSGGALVNLKGELVGINTAIIAPGGGNVGIGFAIPINMARRIMDQLVTYGEMRRGQLGVRIQDLTPELADAMGVDAREGAVVAQVIRGSPADEADLEPGDIITAVDGQPVSNAADMRNKIGLLRVGERAELTVLREGRTLTLAVTLRGPEVAAVGPGPAGSRLRGVVLGPLTEESSLFGQAEGVLVVEVERGNPAWRAGLRPGDVIVSINRQPVRTLRDVVDVVEQGGRFLLLDVRREDGALFIVIG